ncbi:MAG: UDP-2,3-diacylglucosamine diphosphatase [Melioribacteraceae bacterium]|nr:UDP-2,3-diacylglucosamine diphosphatase [Melioribacteraceae bacterium]
MKETCIFISDLHLGLQSFEDERKKERLVEELLIKIKPEVTKLFILGDLFDYWFEYRKVTQRGFFRLFTALQDLTDAGVEVHYLIGNHDFMHRDFFEKELGVKLYKDPVEMIIEGKKFFLAHGDGLVKNDTGYKILKVILRNKFLQWFYSLVHPDFGIWIASSMSKGSRDYTSEKNYGEEDGLIESATNKIKSGFDYVIMGHTHNRIHKKIDNGEYINLGTWIVKPCYGLYKDGKFEILNWKENGEIFK